MKDEYEQYLKLKDGLDDLVYQIMKKLNEAKPLPAFFFGIEEITYDGDVIYVRAWDHNSTRGYPHEYEMDCEMLWDYDLLHDEIEKRKQMAREEREKRNVQSKSS